MATPNHPNMSQKTILSYLLYLVLPSFNPVGITAEHCIFTKSSHAKGWMYLQTADQQDFQQLSPKDGSHQLPPRPAAGSWHRGHPAEKMGRKNSSCRIFDNVFLFVGIWLIFYKIFDDESGIKLEKTCESLGSEDMNWGFSWYPKMLQVTWQPLEFEARFFLADPWACFRPTRRRMSCDSAMILMDVPVIPFNIVDVHFKGFMVHSWFH